MKLKKEFITHDTGTESLLVPAGNAPFAGLVRGNRTMGAMLELLKQETTEQDIVAAMAARFDAPEEAIRADVKTLLDELRRIHALDE